VVVVALLGAAAVLLALAVGRHGHLMWWPFPWTVGSAS
jgi:hypothetical protein